MAQVEWHSVAPAPVVLLTGREPLLLQRAADRLRTLVREKDPEVEIHDLQAGDTTPGELRQVTAPSLFGDARFVLIDNLGRANDQLLDALIDYVQQPEDGVTLVLRHGGEQRGKKLLDTIRKSGAPWVKADPIKKLNDKHAFTLSEFSRARRRIATDAVHALVDAFGSDLAELAATCQQLLSDTQPEPGEEAGPITLRDVEALTAGRVETTAFAVADAAIGGKEREALALLRHAELAGVDPVPLVASFARKLRDVARAAAPGATAQSVGMPDWLFRNQAREARQWTDRGLAAAIQAVASADHGVKGNERDPHWTVQRMVISICRARRIR
ncbi:DNA polymerase III subunit delta [Helcobacillus massiliensis]|uniref:DNA polymerase III subunit delta n=1 Tax=Helcobacillus massiliensis TaxID=521392 RepID=UPI0025570DD8|nr:DNA polymerase III subunit delta [Helcobacillus massiliensis]MDK7741245.1 DNA polymerase III subunit delta [Helcobacillus massiliensis]